MSLFIQQPEEIPTPQPTPPDQRFGEYTFQYFVEENLWYILIVLLIVLIVFGYAWNLNKRRKEAQKELEKEREKERRN